ncbi:hypothetical protein MC7420_331 [Coleofasciculus chthonoplastes PCC 7420]|uniref:Uncharacterized protein n=1 Tax=Coleofasciculus chthonoplastes PCC 7420 TaxID=118168 RepID=B4VL08_9CYAN|nr:hypothetical protein MC7420_331 [Coleofasciculus chthonoplastes PCC 7420]
MREIGRGNRLSENEPDSGTSGMIDTSVIGDEENVSEAVRSREDERVVS